MKKLVEKFGQYNVTAFIIMVVGLILFLITPFLLWLFDFDSDIIGVLIFLMGLMMWVIGLLLKRFRSKK